MCQDTAQAPNTNATKTDVTNSLNRAYSAADQDVAVRKRIGDTLNPYLSNLLDKSSSAATNQSGQAKALSDSAAGLRTDFGAYSPVIRQAATDALGAGSASDQEAAAGQAMQTVNQQTAAAREAATSKLSDMGVDVGSGKMAGALLDANIASAAAAAGAGNKARYDTKQAGVAQRQQAAGLGLNVNNSANATATSAVNADTSAVQTAAAPVSQVLGTGQFLTGGAGTQLNASQLGVNANLGLGSLATSTYNAQSASDNANNAGTGALLGTLGQWGLKNYGTKIVDWVGGLFS